MRDVDLAHLIAIKAVYEHYALQKVDELTFILCLLQKTDTVIEIGSDAGGTSWAIQQMGVHRFIGIDLPGQKGSSGLSWQGSNETEMIWGDSHDPKIKAKLVNTIGNESAEVVIIDGDHTYPGVSEDFRMYGKQLSTGLVIFHDICHHQEEWVGVEQFWRDVKYRFPHAEYISPNDNTWGGIGVLDLSYANRLASTLGK